MNKVERKSSIGFFERIKYVKNIELYVIVIAVLALLLFVVPSGLSKTDSGGTELEIRLEETLSRISGAGKVKVMITTKGSENGYFGESGESEIVGVVIVAKGAGNVAVKVKLINAAAKCLDVSPDKVEVFEMS